MAETCKKARSSAAIKARQYERTGKHVQKRRDLHAKENPNDKAAKADWTRLNGRAHAPTRKHTKTKVRFRYGSRYHSVGRAPEPSTMGTLTVVTEGGAA